jgi:hypothetical protein
VKSFEMQFLDGNKNPPEWVDEWTADKTNQLPKMVMFSLTVADNPKNPQAVEEINRIISLPAVTVQPMWQVPMGVGRPGQPGGLPGQPGGLPGQAGYPPPGVNPNQPINNSRFGR